MSTAHRLASVSALLAASAAAVAGPSYVLLGPAGTVARHVVDHAGASCPGLVTDAGPLAMTLRPVPDGHGAKKFPITICEAVLPAGTARATIDGKALPLPPASVGRIVGLGDTGCRLKADKDSKAGKPGKDNKAGKSGDGDKKGKPADPGGKAQGAGQTDHDDDDGKYQDCNVPGKWPFAAIAAAAASAGPDLVLHVGDYLYRESACPPGDDGCAGSPHKDDWATWQADFFTPAAPLLARAPWIAVRGNHEICKRNGFGYQLLLDPRPAAQLDLTQCSVDITPGYTVTVGGQGFAVLDTSNADDLCKSGKPCNSADYAAGLAQLAAAPAGSWLVTHKPLWAVRKGPKFVTAALQGALPKGGLPAPITLALAGHIHFWQALSFADGRAPQLVLGNGGTLPAGKVAGKLDGMKLGGSTVTQGVLSTEWGYTRFERDRTDWTARFEGVAGTRFDCRIQTARITC